MSERQAGTLRRATATKAEQRMMELLSAAKIPYLWQFQVERWDDDGGDWERTSTGKIKSYMIDFHVSATGVLVEIDGDAHNGKEDYDAKRDKYLESRGYRVLHFSNRMVLHDGKKVIEAIQTELRRVKA